MQVPDSTGDQVIASLTWDASAPRDRSDEKAAISERRPQSASSATIRARLSLWEAT